MPTNIPYNLQFSSFANFRDPNYQQLQQMLGSTQAETWAEWDITAQEREEDYAMWEQEREEDYTMWETEFEASEETAELERESLQLEIDNMSALYSELETYYKDMFAE